MSGAPKGWDVQAHDLWKEGMRAEAVQRVLVPINETPEAPPKPLLTQFAYYLFLLRRRGCAWPRACALPG